MIALILMVIAIVRTVFTTTLVYMHAHIVCTYMHTKHSTQNYSL